MNYVAHWSVSGMRCAGATAYGLSTTASIAGTGGGTPFGPGATGPGLNTGGIAAVNYGTGGSGVVVNQSGRNGTGGAGSLAW
jgi:hypothetical protein